MHKNYPVALALPFILFIPSLVGAQKNLLLNGSFEQHGAQNFLNDKSTNGQYPTLVYHWDNHNWGGLLRDTTYKLSTDERRRGGNPFDKLSPKDGKAMIEMAYCPYMNGIYDGIEGAQYLSARTTAPMMVGELYEISFWIYIDRVEKEAPDWIQHLGIALLPQNVQTNGLYGRKALVIPFLPIDSVPLEQWAQVKWRVRPLCTSNYLMIGVFADPQWPPRTRSFKNSRYFIDQVSVIQVPAASTRVDSAEYYCSKYDPVALGIPPKMDDLVLLFEHNASELSDSNKIMLDSYAVFARQNPDLVFEISGHTDSTGHDNLHLSRQRAQAAYAYLTEKHKLPPIRFYCIAVAEKQPFRPNDTEEGRRLNRRTEIMQSHLDLPAMYYRRAIAATEAGNYPEAFIFLDKWVSTVDKATGKTLVLFDPRFAALQRDKRWTAITPKVRNEYKRMKYGPESFLLDSLWLNYLSVTGDLPRVLLNASGFIPAIDTNELEMVAAPEQKINQIKEEAYKATQTILEKSGWPKRSEFGGASAVAFKFLYLSNDVINFLKWLPALRKACEEGEADWFDYALLYDRSKTLLNQPEHYLTGAKLLDNGENLLPRWEGDENTINEARAKIGLPLLPAWVVEAMKASK